MKKKKPKEPLTRIIQDGLSDVFCPLCGSSLMSEWCGDVMRPFHKNITGCIHPDCDNYYKLYTGKEYERKNKICR